MAVDHFCFGWSVLLYESIVKIVLCEFRMKLTFFSTIQYCTLLQLCLLYRLLLTLKLFQYLLQCYLKDLTQTIQTRIRQFDRITNEKEIFSIFSAQPVMFLFLMASRMFHYLAQIEILRYKLEKHNCCDVYINILNICFYFERYRDFRYCLM